MFNCVNHETAQDTMRYAFRWIGNVLEFSHIN